VEAKLALLRASGDPKALEAAAALEAKLAEVREAEDVGWLLDTKAPIVIHDKTWRKKQRAVLLRPRWAHEPKPNVRAWLEYRYATRDPSKTTDLPEVALADRVDDVREHLTKDFVAFLFACSVFADRNTRKLMRGELTPGQLVLAWRVQAMLDAGVPIRIVFLKVRQAGSSWFWNQFTYWYMGFRENRGVLVLSHEKPTTEQIFGYLRDAYVNMPDELRPHFEHSSTTKLNLNEPMAKRTKGARGLNSQAVVLTAANKLGGTGFPTQGLIASEAGRYHLVSDVEKLMTSIGGGIQEDQPDTFKIIESTAFGAHTWFHKECEAARVGHGNPGWNTYTFIFIPWFFDPRNAVKRTSLTLDDLGTSEKDEFGDERALMERFDLTLEQLEWRQQRIAAMPDDGRSKIDLFKQDFPATPEEAWLYAHGKAFAAEFIATLRARVDAEALKPIFVGDMQHQRKLGTDLVYLADGRHENEWLMRRPYGPLRIYLLPNPRYDHLVGADVALGITGGDRSCFKVYRRVDEDKKSMRLAAEWYGLAEEDQFAHMLWRIGWFYSCGWGTQRTPAMLAWEATGAGASIARWLRKGENPESQNDPYPASRMFRKQSSDKIKNRFDMRYGIQTTGQSKPVILSEFVKAARADELQLISEDVDEAETLERDERDKIDTHGKDRFMAVAMAAFAAVTTPIYWGVEEEKKEAPKKYTGAWFRQQREIRDAVRASTGSYTIRDLTLEDL
jgi:hypothetical protein